MNPLTIVPGVVGVPQTRLSAAALAALAEEDLELVRCPGCGGDYYRTASTGQPGRCDGCGPILVGEANPYSRDPEMALFHLPRGATGDRLRRLVLGLRAWRYERLRRFDLCERRWSIAEAREEAQRLRNAYPTGRFVLLGVKVAEAFGWKITGGYVGAESEARMPPLAAEHFLAQPKIRPEETHALVGQGRLIFIPHPSGLNRFWHRPEAVRVCREVLRAEFPHLPLGEIDGGPDDE